MLLLIHLCCPCVSGLARYVSQIWGVYRQAIVCRLDIIGLDLIAVVVYISWWGTLLLLCLLFSSSCVMLTSSAPVNPAVPAGVGSTLASTSARLATPAADPSTQCPVCGSVIQYKRRRTVVPNEEDQRPNLRADEEVVLEDGYLLAPPPYLPCRAPNLPLSDAIALSNEIATATTAALCQLVVICATHQEEDITSACFDAACDTVFFKLDQYDVISAHCTLAWRHYNIAVHGRDVVPNPRSGYVLVYDRDDGEWPAVVAPIVKDGDAGEPVGTCESSIIEIF